jgi:hypothetical protein
MEKETGGRRQETEGKGRNTGRMGESEVGDQNGKSGQVLDSRCWILSFG